MLVPFIHWVRFVGLDTIQLEMIVGEEKEGTTYLSSLFHALHTIQDTYIYVHWSPQDSDRHLSVFVIVHCLYL